MFPLIRSWNGYSNRKKAAGTFVPYNIPPKTSHFSSAYRVHKTAHPIITTPTRIHTHTFSSSPLLSFSRPFILYVHTSPMISIRQPMMIRLLQKKTKMTTFPTIFLVVITGLLMTTTLVTATTPTPTIAPTSGPTTTTTSPTTDSDTTTCDCINDYSCQYHTFDGTTCKVLNCIGQNSCRDAVITNLDIVNCIGEDSCKDADISYITGEINCLGKSSCAQQQVSNVNDASIWNFLGDGVVVNCLGDSSCFDTDIYANENRAMNECDHDDTENHCSSITIVCGDGDGDDGMACGYSHLSHGPDGSIICRGNDNANSYLDATCFETNTPAETTGKTTTLHMAVS